MIDKDKLRVWEFKHILKATVAVAQYGLVDDIKFSKDTISCKLRIDLKFGRVVKSLGIAIAILDIMQIFANLSRPFKMQFIEIKCYVGGDLHIMKTDIEWLRYIYKLTGGKRDLLTSNIINEWIRKSKYIFKPNKIKQNKLSRRKKC